MRGYYHNKYKLDADMVPIKNVAGAGNEDVDPKRDFRETAAGEKSNQWLDTLSIYADENFRSETKM